MLSIFYFILKYFYRIIMLEFGDKAIENMGEETCKIREMEHLPHTVHL